MMKILIACQCASNKGDRAIAEYLVDQLSKLPEVEITLSATDPKLWSYLPQKGVKVIGAKKPQESAISVYIPQERGRAVLSDPLPPLWVWAAAFWI